MLILQQERVVPAVKQVNHEKKLGLKNIGG